MAYHSFDLIFAVGNMLTARMTARHQRFTATSDLIKRGEACSAIWIWKGPSGKPSRVSFPGPFAGAWWCNVQASASLLLKSLGVLEMGNTFYWGRSWVKQLPLNLLQLLSTDFSFQGALFCGTGVRSLCIWKFDLFFFFFRIKTTFDTKSTQILHLVKQEMSTTPELSIQELIYPQDEEGIPFRCPNLKSWESCLERFVGFVGVARLFNPHGKYIVKLFVQGKWRKASTWVSECFLNARQWTCQFQGADWRRGPNRLRNAWEQYVRRRLSSDLSLFLLLRVKLHLQPAGVSARRLLSCPRVTTTTSFGRSYLLKPCPVLKWPIT